MLLTLKIERLIMALFRLKQQLRLMSKSVGLKTLSIHSFEGLRGKKA